MKDEDGLQAGQYDKLAERLKRENIQVTIRDATDGFSSLGDLQPFDTVILANTPRAKPSVTSSAVLVQNTQQMGAGLIMLGGPQSFGAGGWGGSELEAAMPVDFQIKNAKIAPSGALAMLMHACEMANGNFWQKQIANTAVDGLSDTDYCGVLDPNSFGPVEMGSGFGKVKLTALSKLAIVAK